MGGSSRSLELSELAKQLPNGSPGFRQCAEDPFRSYGIPGVLCSAHPLHAVKDRCVLRPLLTQCLKSGDTSVKVVVSPTSVPVLDVLD